MATIRFSDKPPDLTGCNISGPLNIEVVTDVTVSGYMTPDQKIDALCQRLQELKGKLFDIDFSIKRPPEEVPPLAGSAHIRELRPGPRMTIRIEADFIESELIPAR